MLDWTFYFILDAHVKEKTANFPIPGTKIRSIGIILIGVQCVV